MSSEVTMTLPDPESQEDTDVLSGTPSAQSG